MGAAAPFEPARNRLSRRANCREAFFSKETKLISKPMIAFGHFFDLESAHEGILCRNIAMIPQENNHREDNFSVFSKILTRDGCCAPVAKTEAMWR